MQFPFTLKKKQISTSSDSEPTRSIFLSRFRTTPNSIRRSSSRTIIRQPAARSRPRWRDCRDLACERRYIGRFGTDNAGDIGLGSLRRKASTLTYAEKIDGARDADRVHRDRRTRRRADGDLEARHETALHRNDVPRRRCKSREGSSLHAA